MSAPLWQARALAKVLGHVARYPCSPITGIVLARRDNDVVALVDAVPLFHEEIPVLTLSWELALEQLEAYCAASNLSMVGVYHSHEVYKDTIVPEAIARVAQVLADRSSLGGWTFMIEKSDDFISTRKWQQNKWIPAQSTISPEIKKEALSFISQRHFLKLNDFDEHLQDPLADYLNSSLNALVS